jgi:hypothetical protein
LFWSERSSADYIQSEGPRTRPTAYTRRMLWIGTLAELCANGGEGRKREGLSCSVSHGGFVGIIPDIGR